MAEIVFPIIKFMDNDKYIASVEKVFSGDKRLILKESKFNSNFEIIDCQGNLFFIKKLHPKTFSLWLSITLVGIIYKLTPEYKFIRTITLIEAKKRIWNHVSTHKSFWSPINDGRGLKRMIYEAKDYKELILMFK